MQFSMHDKEYFQERGIGDKTLECLSKHNEETVFSIAIRILPKFHWPIYVSLEEDLFKNSRVPWNSHKFNDKD